MKTGAESNGRRVALVFPGQGSQSVGMGRSWADRWEEAAAVFAAADEALGEPLSDLCWNGPAKDLQLTANAQPAILTASIATYRVLERLGVAPVVVAGHSLGEYSAQVATGALAFTDAVRLVRKRGELMQEAVPVGEGAMAAILGLEAGRVAELAAEAAGGDVCAVANYNAPGQTVIAGSHDAVLRAMKLAEAGGARRALQLPVSAPFHSALMRPAREALTPHLEAVSFGDPVFPVITNVDAAPVTDGAAARQALIRQVDAPVRWVESVETMVAGWSVDLFVEVGPGSVLTGLIRRIARGIQTRGLAEADALEELLRERTAG